MTEVLNKMNTDLARKEEELQEATAKITKIETMAEDQTVDAKEEVKGRIAKAHRSTVEAFKASMEFVQEKLRWLKALRHRRNFMMLRLYSVRRPLM